MRYLQVTIKSNSKLNEVDTQIREENLSKLRQEPSSFNLVKIMTCPR